MGEPDERQHWALPHHYLGKGPNEQGVRSAKSRLPQTENLANRQRAEAHLDAHMREINPQADAGTEDPVLAEEQTTGDGAERRSEWEEVLSRVESKLEQDGADT